MLAHVFQVGSFDVTKFSEEELWARMNSTTQFYSALTENFRLLAYSRTYPLDEPLTAIRQMMANAPDPQAREQIAAYRRFVEQIVQAAYLKDTDYYLAVFGAKSPQILANVLAGGLRLPVRHVSGLPALFQEPYHELPDCLRPTRRGPYVALLYSYDLRGQVSLATTIHFLSLPFPVYLAVDVKTIHPKRAIRTLQFAYNKLRADVVGRSGNEMPDPQKEQAYLDVQEAMALVTNQGLGLHQVGLGLAVFGGSRKELNEHVELVQAAAGRNQIYLRRAWCHQRDALAFFSPQPMADSIVRAYRNVDSRGVACLTATSYEARKNTDGPFVAINRATGSPLWLDKFSLPAYNEVILGRTGSGKTFMAGLRAYREIMLGIRSVFIDPQGSFRKLTLAVGGSYNQLRLGMGTALNVLDVVHEHPAAQISHVVVMLEALLGRGLSGREKAAVDKVLLGLYDRAIRTDADLEDAARMPLLEDLLGGLWNTPGGQDLALDLERFVAGSLREIFNAHTTLTFDLDPRFPIITFDVSDLEGEFQPALVYALLSGVERAIRRRRSQQMPTNIVLDEFFILSRIPTLAEAAGALAKRVRAWKVGIQCLDQNWSTFDTPAGRQILENTLVKTIMRVDDTAAPAIVQALGLIGHHADVILSADVGEGVMIIENKPYHVYFQAGRSEVEMLTPYTRHLEEMMQGVCKGWGGK
jgi:hypothetical protein